MTMAEQLLDSSDPERQGIRARLAEAEYFDIQNVAEYLYAQTDQEIWEVKKDFPCLAPPFRSFWMEHTRPSRIVSCVAGVIGSEYLPHRIGMLFYFEDRTELCARPKSEHEQAAKECAEVLDQMFTPAVQREIESVLDSGVKLYDLDNPAWKELSTQALISRGRLLEYLGNRITAEKGSGHLFEEIDQLNQAPLRWVGACMPFLQAERNSPVMGPLGFQNLVLDDVGNVINVSNTINLKLIKPEAWNAISTLWFPALLAISFCHCKNVTMKREEAPTKLLKRQRERGRHPLMFKTLEITPMKAVLEKAGAGSASGGLQRALHICRGHFANYAEKGLFGKYFGRFWISQHVRGAIDAGAVVKHYDVKAPS